MSAVFTVDLVGLLDRLSRLEQECKELRELVQKNNKDVYLAIDETKDLIFDYAPTLNPDNTLVFETSDQESNKVYAHVAATEVRAEQ